MPPKRKSTDNDSQSYPSKKCTRDDDTKNSDFCASNQDVFDSIGSASQFMQNPGNSWDYSNILTPSQNNMPTAQVAFTPVANRNSFNNSFLFQSQDDIPSAQPSQPDVSLSFSQLSDQQLSQTGLPSHLIRLKKHAANAISARQTLSHSVAQPLFNTTSTSSYTSTNNVSFPMSLPDTTKIRSVPIATATSSTAGPGANNQSSSTRKVGDSIPSSFNAVMSQMLDTMKDMSASFVDLKKTMADYMDTNRRTTAPPQSTTGSVEIVGFDYEANVFTGRTGSGQLPVVMKWLMLQNLAPASRSAYCRAWNEF